MPQLPAAACRSRFASARVARLATAGADGRPHLVPVTYVLMGERLVTAVDQKPKSTTRLRRLRNIAANPAVSLLVDWYDDDWRQLWWARADGTAVVVSAGPDHDRYVDALVAKYPQYRRDPPRGPAIVVEVTSWAGWSYR